MHHSQKKRAKAKANTFMHNIACNIIVANIEASPIKASIKSFHLQLKISIIYWFYINPWTNNSILSFVAAKRSLISLPPITHVSTLSMVVLEEVVMRRLQCPNMEYIIPWQR